MVLTATNEDTPLMSTQDLTANDGPIGTNLLLNHDARATAGTGTWENIGPVSPALVYNLTGVTLNNSPGGTRGPDHGRLRVGQHSRPGRHERSRRGLHKMTS